MGQRVAPYKSLQICCHESDSRLASRVKKVVHGGEKRQARALSPPGGAAMRGGRGVARVNDPRVNLSSILLGRPSRGVIL